MKEANYFYMPGVCVCVRACVRACVCVCVVKTRFFPQYFVWHLCISLSVLLLGELRSVSRGHRGHWPTFVVWQAAVSGRLCQPDDQSVCSHRPHLLQPLSPGPYHSHKSCCLCETGPYHSHKSCFLLWDRCVTGCDTQSVNLASSWRIFTWDLSHFAGLYIYIFYISYVQF